MTSLYAPSGRIREKIDPKKADRTAIAQVNVPFHSPRWGDAELRVWPNRDAMARAIRREQEHAPYSRWTPVEPLGLTEGY